MMATPHIRPSVGQSAASQFVPRSRGNTDAVGSGRSMAASRATVPTLLNPIKRSDGFKASCDRQSELVSTARGSQPLSRSSPTEPQRKWKEALELARDIVSVLNVESFSGFGHMGTSTLYAEAALRELAMFDHLFGLRQWRLSFTQDFLTDFFASDHDDVFKSKLGWTPANVVALCGAVRVFANSDPKVITMGALRQSGIRRDLLDRILPYFVHAQSVVNAHYLSPFSATKADLMFKPLIQLGPNHLLLQAT